MFNENLKALRKQKGYSQEQLAIELNVVRQTVSKWEKGLSVPDVEMLQSIADVLDVPISQLLDTSIEEAESKTNEAEQLARVAEQMAIQNRRRKKIWKTIAIILIIAIVVPTIMTIIGLISFIGLNTISTSNVEVENDSSYIEITSEEFLDNE